MIVRSFSIYNTERSTNFSLKNVMFVLNKFNICFVIPKSPLDVMQIYDIIKGAQRN